MIICIRCITIFEINLIIIIIIAIKRINEKGMGETDE